MLRSGNTPSYPASVTFTNGVGTASITLYDAQNGITLTATQGSATGHSGTFNVAPGGASSFTVGTPSSATAGTSSPRR